MPQDQDPLIKIEYYNDTNPEQPSAYTRYLLGISEHVQDIHAGKYKTVVLDSFSAALRSARWYEQFVKNAGAVGKAKMQWYGESGDALERNISGPFKAFPCNVIVIGHVGSKRDDVRGQLFWGVEASGRLSQSLPRDFGEVYFADVGRDEEERRFHLIQTAKDDQYFAKSHLGLPDAMEVQLGKGYQNLVENSSKKYMLEENNAGQPISFRVPLHILLYGDSGSGKSIFASSFPKPMLVLMWDGFDNAIPYLEQGQPSPIKGYGDIGEGGSLADETKWQEVYSLEEEREE